MVVCVVTRLTRKFTMQEEYKRHKSGAMVSSKGTVIGVLGRILTPTISKHGYAVISLTNPDGTKTRSVHRAVVETFIGDIPEGMVVNHLNGDKLDNRIENLEITTRSRNTKHAYENGFANGKSGEDNSMAKLTNLELESLCCDLMQGKTNAEISAKYGLHDRYVSLIRHKKRWKNLIPTWYIPTESLGNTGLTVEFMAQVVEACRTGERNRDIAERFNLDRSTISRIRSGKTWQAFLEYYNNIVVQRPSEASEYTQAGGKAENLRETAGCDMV